TIARIDREAANFWSKRPGAIARAEELYHRLRLGEARDVLESRWDPEAALHLRGALGEVPDASRAWLADKLGASLDETTRSAAAGVWSLGNRGCQVAGGVSWSRAGGRRHGGCGRSGRTAPGAARSTGSTRMRSMRSTGSTRRPRSSSGDWPPSRPAAPPPPRS